MTDGNEPMIKLEPNGSAPVISYNVPEPTSYAGRNFIDLQIPASYFVRSSPAPNVAGIISEETSGNSSTSEAFMLRSSSDNALESLMSSDQINGVDLALRSGFFVSGDEDLSSRLRNLNPEEIQVMASAGKRLNIFRSMHGEVTVNFLDARVAPPLANVATALPIRDDGNGTGNGPIPRVPLFVRITQPPPGQKFSGPHTGARVDVSGGTGVSPGSVAKVEVQIGAGPFQQATLSEDGTSWHYTETVTQAGTLTVTARATKSGAVAPFATATDTVSINVELQLPPDVTPAAVRITSPTASDPLLSPATGGPLTVNVTGTADDPSGVKQVEVALDAESFAVAAPFSPNDWSQWSRQLSLSPGVHTIKARATDNAGNVSAPVSVSVTVNVAKPPDTDRPVVNITTPVNGAPVPGPFSGATVNVTGSASDLGGVRGVELIVDQSPVTIQAQPKAVDDWSTWTASLVITVPGPHVITALATDNAGNTEKMDIAVTVTLVPDVTSRLTRLILVESYRLSSYLGNYGAGKTVNTFSLLPAEQAKISVTSYNKTEKDAKSASSILDSFTQESADDFETSMANEQSDKKGYEESFNYKVGAEAEASWGWGKAKVSGEVSGGTNGTREEFAKNISNSVQKHAAKASAKRDIQINTSYEVKSTTEEKTSLERVIENINVGRTLNFVFRQMNQEYVTLLHLVDARIGFYRIDTVNGKDQATYREVTLPQLGDLLQDVIVEARRTEVVSMIMHQLTNIFDYKDQQHQFVEEKPLKDAAGKVVPFSQYLRVRKDYTSIYDDEATGMQITVPGIILAADKHVLRTDGIIVEALLGEGDGLDDYSQGLQEEAVRAQVLSNAQAEAEIMRAQLAQKIVEKKDAAAADIFAKVYPPPIQIVPAGTSSNGQSAP